MDAQLPVGNAEERRHRIELLGTVCRVDDVCRNAIGQAVMCDVTNGKVMRWRRLGLVVAKKPACLADPVASLPGLAPLAAWKP
jgi:hypothetical protein